MTLQDSAFQAEYEGSIPFTRSSSVLSLIDRAPFAMIGRGVGCRSYRPEADPPASRELPRQP